MILFDTDHFSALKYGQSEIAPTLSVNMSMSVDQEFTTSVVTLEEQLRGWLSLINATTDVDHQLHAYKRLVELVQFFSAWRIIHFDQAAADEFKRLRKQGIRIGTMDLKIASIALTHDATLVTANLRDFEQVPNLRIENWLS